MLNSAENSLKTLVLLCFSVMRKCNFTNHKSYILIQNCTLSPLILNFIEILKSIGVKVEIEGESIKVASHGASSFFIPEKEIDVKGEKSIFFAMVGLFANLDCNLFFINSGKNDESLSNLILGLFDAGVRFSYNKNFTFPVQMKGTSNFLPMTHSLFSENKLLALSFILSGLSGLGRTTVIFPKKAEFFHQALVQTEANFRATNLEDGAFCLSIAEANEMLEKEIILDLKKFEPYA